MNHPSSPGNTASEDILHASAVQLGARGLLIRGASGSGKSTLALELISRGATLVADDRVQIRKVNDGGIQLSPPGAIEGLIEARGIGLIRLPFTAARLTDVIDLDHEEYGRLPVARETVIGNKPFPCLYRVEHPAFAAMVFAYLAGERQNP